MDCKIHNNMKINIAHTSNRSIAKRFNRSGMTLIEISLVIALLLGLIAVVFMGIGSYRTGADKAKCKMQLAAVQKAVRSGANLQDLAIGATLASSDVFGTGKLMENPPVCPGGGAFTWGSVVPAIGTAYGTCALHALTTADTTDW